MQADDQREDSAMSDTVQDQSTRTGRAVTYVPVMWKGELLRLAVNESTYIRRLAATEIPMDNEQRGPLD